jgi:hypothetical protein
MQVTSRLAHLLELADKGPALRAALAEEVADLLIDWPGDCPDEMRGVCEALLANTAREVDEQTRARLHLRLFDDPALAARVLPRAANACRDLIEIARDGGDVAAGLSEALNLSRDRVMEILADSSGRALAIACKGLKISRTTFSTLTLLKGVEGQVGQYYSRLDVFDSIDSSEAANRIADWRAQDKVRHAA